MSAVCAVGWTLFAVAALIAAALVVSIIGNYDTWKAGQRLEDQRRGRKPLAFEDPDFLAKFEAMSQDVARRSERRRRMESDE